MKINYFYKGLKESVPDKYILDTYLDIITQRIPNDKVEKSNIYKGDLDILFGKCVWYITKKSNISYEAAKRVLLEFFKKRKTKNSDVLRDTILYCYLLEINDDSDNRKRKR